MAVQTQSRGFPKCLMYLDGKIISYVTDVSYRVEEDGDTVSGMNDTGEPIGYRDGSFKYSGSFTAVPRADGNDINFTQMCKERTLFSLVYASDQRRAFDECRLKSAEVTASSTGEHSIACEFEALKYFENS